MKIKILKSDIYSKARAETHYEGARNGEYSKLAMNVEDKKFVEESLFSAFTSLCDALRQISPKAELSGDVIKVTLPQYDVSLSDIIRGSISTYLVDYMTYWWYLTVDKSRAEISAAKVKEDLTAIRSLTFQRKKPTW